MIEIGKTIYTLLSANASLTNLIGNKIYPLVIPADEQLPVVVYERQGNNDSTKDGGAVNNINFDITILSENYAEAIRIAVTIHQILNDYSGVVNGVKIIKIKLTNINETYAEDAFIESLSYSIKAI